MFNPDDTFEPEYPDFFEETLDPQDDFEPEYDDSLDGDHTTALESVYGPEDSYLDSYYEDQFDLGDG